ncbi:DUF3570 domain-containing protein [Povalibacter sp.]|uniref:DUF3570 domain-containing protein n=1 Tax=Povalibacter sp. TaxID=1962978 RepID=UPI002F427416
MASHAIACARRWLSIALLGLTAAAYPLASSAGVLPEDRADVLYHRYDGGGVTIHGPSVLVRKTMAEKYSASANYYMDMVTSASIDVEVSGASEYKEERNQYSLGFDYLRGKTTYSLGYTNSDENDYQASTTSFGISQDLFGDLTTISMGFSKGDDTVRRTIADPNDAERRIVDPGFKQDVDRWSYRVGVSQILTRNMILGLQLEVITDEGYLNNPYRSFRYVDPDDDLRFRLATEIYPHTRTSNAAGVNARYFLPWRAAAFGGYRYFTDTWGIDAGTFELGYMHPLKGTRWTFEASIRHYNQDHADFYADIFDRVDQQNFMGRDKELSTFVSNTFHVAATYEFVPSGWRFIKKGTLNLSYDRMQFDYDDYRDARYSLLPTDDPNFRAAGTEQFYSFGANVIQAFISVWF